MQPFLDVDGVVANFPKAMCEAHNQPYLNAWVTPEMFGLSTKDFWAPCNHESFWANMEWMPDGRMILEAVERAFGKPFLLTAPTLSSQSYSGKIKWLERNMPDYVRRCIICPCGDELNKAIVAQPDRVLIDDTDLNIDSWVKAGGVGILVPRPWNTMSWGTVERTLEGLKACY